jgi:hypothetical protein
VTHPNERGCLTRLAWYASLNDLNALHWPYVPIFQEPDVRKVLVRWPEQGQTILKRSRTA